MGRKDLIRKSEVEKYHIIKYEKGEKVSVLRNNKGKRFIWVSSTRNRSPEFVLPKGYTIITHKLKEDKEVNLSGVIEVLRLTTNQDSFQGPIADNLVFD